MVGVAVNVTDCPGQWGFGLAEMLTETGNAWITWLIVFDVATADPVIHESLEVITTCTECVPVVRDDVEYVELFVPTGLPFTYH